MEIRGLKSPLQSVEWLETEHTASETDTQLLEKQQAHSMPKGRRARPIVVTT